VPGRESNRARQTPPSSYATPSNYLRHTLQLPTPHPISKLRDTPSRSYAPHILKRFQITVWYCNFIAPTKGFVPKYRTSKLFSTLENHQHAYRKHRKVFESSKKVSISWNSPFRILNGHDDRLSQSLPSPQHLYQQKIWSVTVKCSTITNRTLALSVSIFYIWALWWDSQLSRTTTGAQHAFTSSVNKCIQDLHAIYS